MRFIKRTIEKLNEPKESKRGVIMWACPLCPAVFWSQTRADAHAATCRGE